MKNNIQARMLRITYPVPGTNRFKTTDWYSDREMEQLSDRDFCALVHTLETAIYPTLTGPMGNLLAVQVVNKCAQWN